MPSQQRNKVGNIALLLSSLGLLLMFVTRAQSRIAFDS
jgi:hypothetical protein